MEVWANTIISGAVFVWMLRIERRITELTTTCKIKGGCNSGEDSKDA